MKTIFRYILFLALYSCCNTVSAYTSFIVGNNAGVCNKYRGNLPQQMTFNYTSTASNLVFYKPTQLGPTGVKMYLVIPGYRYRWWYSLLQYIWQSESWSNNY